MGRFLFPNKNLLKDFTYKGINFAPVIFGVFCNAADMACVKYHAVLLGTLGCFI